MFSYWDDGMIMTCQPLLSRPVALATRSAEVLAAALCVGSGLLWYRLTRRASQADEEGIGDVLVLG